ncbi:MAG: carbohydrate-binding protein, partial [Gaiellales bacterium]
SSDQVYLAGSKVLYNGMVYQAKWWTQSDTPSSDPTRPSDVPWKVVGEETAADMNQSTAAPLTTTATTTTAAPTTTTAATATAAVAQSAATSKPSK